MIGRALTFLVSRLLFLMIFLLAVNAFSQGSNCRYGDAQGIMPALASLPKALRTLNESFRP